MSVLALGAVLALSAASPASARELITLGAPASNGYSLEINTVAGPEPRVAVAQFIREQAGVFGGAFYTKRAAGGYENRRLRIDIGGYASVRAKFAKQDTERDVDRFGPSNCRLIRVEKTGVFRGRIQGSGELGFSTVDVNRAPGSIERYRLRGCRAPAPAVRAVPRTMQSIIERAKPRRSWDLGVCAPGPRTVFHAERWRTGAQFDAAAYERDGGVGIYRFLDSLASRSSFTLARNGRRAMVRPPRGFDGTGRFRNGTLTGNLTANFPGAPGTPLTPGSGYLDPNGDRSLPCDPFGGFPRSAPDPRRW